MSSAFVGFQRVVGIFRNRNYARYVAGNSISLIGLWMQRIGVGWLAWELTGSPAWLGIIAMAEFFPIVFLGPIGGVLADRFRRTTNIIVFQSVATITSLTLCLVTLFGLVNIWLLAALTLIAGITAGLNSASRLALAPSLVPTGDLTTAIAMNSMVFNTARFIGPAIAGVVIKFWGVEVAFAGNAASYLALIWALLVIQRSLPRREGEKKERFDVIAEMTEGMSIVAANKGTLAILLMMLASALLVRPIVQLLPGISDQLLASGVDGFAALTATVGGGAIVGGYWMAQSVERDNLRVGLIGIVASALANIALVSVTNLTAALPLAFLLGAGLVITGVGIQSALQFAVPETYRGRVLSLYGIVFMGGPALGTLIVGGIAEVVGLRYPNIVGALLILLPWLIVWRQRQSIADALRDFSEKPD